MLPAAGQRLGRTAALSSGTIAGPLFVAAFTTIGALRPGYDWRHLPVSSLACGRGGWLQRANFVLTGSLYCHASTELARCPDRRIGPRAVALLVAGVGVGLIGSGVFVTDPVGGFPPSPTGGAGNLRVGPADSVRTLGGRLHNLFAIPIFAGIPIAALASAVTAIRGHDCRWAAYSAGSAASVVGTFLLFGAAFAPSSRLAQVGGIFQRVSIGVGFGWLSALSFRAGHRG